MDSFLLLLIPAILCTYPFLHVYLFSRLTDSLLNSGKRLSDTQRIVFFWAVIVAPTLLLLLANATMSGPRWKGGTGALGWISLTTVGEAGSAIMPVWLVGCAVLSAGFLVASNDSIYKSRINLMMTLTLAAICFWRAGVWIGSDTPEAAAISVACALPPGVNLLLLAIHTFKYRRWSPGAMPTVVTALAWLVALATTIYCKIILALGRYNALPEVEPEHCFIVTAAAQGNRRFVGSEFNSSTGRMENAQLARMRALERYLIAEFPAGHRLLRKVYNRIGPVIARRIRRPLIADAAYIILKPLELLAIVVCKPNSGE
jgi:hypothetical protein